MWCCNELILLLLLLILLDDESDCRPMYKIDIDKDECTGCNSCNDEENNCGNVVIYSQNVNVFKVYR